MPTISVSKKFLWGALEKDAKYSIEDFEALGMTLFEHHDENSANHFLTVCLNHDSW